MNKVKITRKKILNIGIIKVTRTHPDGTIDTYNEILTTPDLGKEQWNLLGYHFVDYHINSAVDYLERKNEKNRT